MGTILRHSTRNYYLAFDNWKILTFQITLAAIALELIFKKLDYLIVVYIKKPDGALRESWLNNYKFKRL